MSANLNLMLVELGQSANVILVKAGPYWEATRDPISGDPHTSLGDTPNDAVRRLWLQVFGTRQEVAG